MRPHQLFGALLALIGFIVMVALVNGNIPAALSNTDTLTAGVVLVAVPAIMVASHADPQLSGAVGGLFLFIIALVNAPALFAVVDIGVAETSGALSLVIQLAMPLLFLVFIATMATRRLRQA